MGSNEAETRKFCTLYVKVETPKRQQYIFRWPYYFFRLIVGGLENGFPFEREDGDQFNPETLACEIGAITIVIFSEL